VRREHCNNTTLPLPPSPCCASPYGGHNPTRKAHLPPLFRGAWVLISRASVQGGEECPVGVPGLPWRRKRHLCQPPLQPPRRPSHRHWRSCPPRARLQRPPFFPGLILSLSLSLSRFKISRFYYCYC